MTRRIQPLFVTIVPFRVCDRTADQGVRDRSAASPATLDKEDCTPELSLFNQLKAVSDLQ